MRNTILGHILTLIIVALAVFGTSGCNMSELVQVLETAEYFVSPDGQGLTLIAWYDGEQWVAQMYGNKLVSAGRASVDQLRWTYQLLRNSGWVSTTWAAIPQATKQIMLNYSTGYGTPNVLLLLPAWSVDNIQRYTQPGMVVQ